MDSLTLFTVRDIAHYLTRIDCIFWSRCSKAMYALVSPACYLRLTREQSAVVERVLALTPEDWHSHFSLTLTHSFPPQYVISTGTSTGKTVMAYVVATEHVRRGRSALVVVQRKLYAQWIGEYHKFQVDMKLAPLLVVENTITPHTTPAIIMMDRTTVTALADPEKEWEEAMLPDFMALVPRLGVVIVDENAITHWFTRSAPFAGISLLLDASASNIAGAAAIDPLLGRVPTLEVTCVVAVELGRSDTLESFLPLIQEWCSKSEGKTIIASNDVCADVRRPGKGQNILTQLTIEGATHVLASAKGPRTRSTLIHDFATATSGVLVSTLTYIGKGFNIPCNTLIIFDLNGRIQGDVLLQIVGRVRRVQTGITTVKVYYITSNPQTWKLFAAFRKPTTDEIFLTAYNLGGPWAIRAMGVNLETPAPNVYTLTVPHTPALPPAPYEGPPFPVDERYRQRPGAVEVTVYQDYSFTIVGKDGNTTHQGCTTMQILVPTNPDEEFVILWKFHRFTTNFDRRVNRNMVDGADYTYRTERMLLPHAIMRFQKSFVAATGNDWRSVAAGEPFVREPNLSCLISRHPITVPANYYYLVCVENETVDPIEPWVDTPEMARRITQAVYDHVGRQRLIVPGLVTPPPGFFHSVVLPPLKRTSDSDTSSAKRMRPDANE